MIKAISEETWTRYNALLPRSRKIYEPVLPANLPYQGKVEGAFDYVLPEKLLKRLREWLNKRGEKSVYYFLTESVQGEKTDYKISTSHLTRDNLLELNTANENAIVGEDFTWAIFVDHEGALHVSGPKELLSFLRAENC